MLCYFFLFNVLLWGFSRLLFLHTTIILQAQPNCLEHIHEHNIPTIPMFKRALSTNIQTYSYFESITLLLKNFDRKIEVLITFFLFLPNMLKQSEQFHNFILKCISGNKLTGSSPIICASWNSLLRMKFLPKVAVTLDITDVLSRSMVWYRGSGRSPVNLKMVIHNACAACNLDHSLQGCLHF